MSSTGNVLRLAVQELEVENKVFVVDSKSLSTGIGLQIIEAAIMAEQGTEAAEIVEKIRSMQPRVRASFVVDTLTYLHRGGRCSGLAALAGSALKLHPLISVVDGKMLPGKKYRGKMNRVIIDYVKDMEEDLKHAKADRVFITHSGCEEEIPVIGMLAATEEVLRAKAEKLASMLHSAKVETEILPTEGRVGGGSVPNHALPSYAVAFSENVNTLEETLRTGLQPIIGRIHEGKFLLDVRTLFEEDFPTIVEALKEALQ